VSQITRGAGGDYQPNWSPDEKWITFFSSRSGTPNIWTVECAGGNLLQLTKGEAIDINPFYSPDGKRIAYQSDRSGRTEVWIMNSDGSEQRRLTSIGCSGHFLRWTKQGDAVIFRCPYGSKPGVYRIALDAEEPEPLAEVVGGAHISLSPDHSLILDVLAHKTLWVSPLSQSEEARKIFEFENPSVRIDYPVWSPDGNWILFDRFEPQGGDIWMIENFESK
jgi:Tol biopolymer transport system component